MNKGTIEGTIEEKEFVKELNKNKNSEFWKIINLLIDNKQVYAIHVIYKKYGKINNQKILPKADLFLAKTDINIPKDYLVVKNYYLNEDDLIKFKLTPIEFTGISVKRKDSKKYQIIKMSPNTFKKIFKYPELGAGASIFCSNDIDIKNNIAIMLGWGTSLEKFKKFFNLSFDPTIDDYKRIKTKSNQEITKQIKNNPLISDFIFKGIGNFEEPYTANWILEGGKLNKITTIPFVITTGSGRHRGDYTLVVKPK